MLSSVIKTARPLQWIKNTFVFAGLLFSGNLLHLESILLTIYTFIIFCFAASGVYFFNDIIDKEKDANHPRKKFRPIASGNLSLSIAILFMILIWVISLVWSYLLNFQLFILILSYIILHIVYSILLKKLVIWDLIAVSAGFVMRAAGGAIILDVYISSWLLVCTSLLALFLITAKRRAELANVSNSKFTRPVLQNYSLKYLDTLLIIIVASTITAYSLYVFSSETIEKFGTRALGFTIPFVVYGLFRYLYLIFVKHTSSDDNISITVETPEKMLFKDLPFLLNIIMWILIVVYVIYMSLV